MNEDSKPHAFVCSVRKAGEPDCSEIARLTAQLGYPGSLEVTRQRFRRLIESDTDAVFVAQARDDAALAGWIHGALSQYLESDYRAEIAGLVVDARFHRKGIGRALVARVESWAIERGAAQTVVRCQTSRKEAHLFYESLGYGRIKTQIVFRKSLP